MDTNYNFILLSSQKIILIERDDGRKERNKLWRRKQQYRLLKSRIVKRADGFRGFMLDDGTYVQHPHWTQLIKSHWAQVYKTTSTPCSCPLCQGESYSRLAYEHETKRIIEESEM